MAMELRRLDRETWGERVARARSRSRISLKEAAARVSGAMMPVSYSTLMRLEWMDEPPSDDRRKVTAYAAILAYGFDPADFGLDDDTMPSYVDTERVRDLLIRSTGCFEPVAA